MRCRDQPCKYSYSKAFGTPECTHRSERKHRGVTTIRECSAAADRFEAEDAPVGGGMRGCLASFIRFGGPRHETVPGCESASAVSPDVWVTGLRVITGLWAARRISRALVG